jgi:hypothetical protein
MCASIASHAGPASSRRQAAIVTGASDGASSSLASTAARAEIHRRCQTPLDVAARVGERDRAFPRALARDLQREGAQYLVQLSGAFIETGESGRIERGQSSGRRSVTAPSTAFTVQ